MDLARPPHNVLPDALWRNATDAKRVGGRSGYVYQIYAYLRSQVGLGDPLADSASGLLLHPSVGDVDQTAVIQGHSIRFATVDLAASAADVRAQLLRVCEPVQH
jgi:5-methylcytosine-specific restriction enzyme subunit McrC